MSFSYCIFLLNKILPKWAKKTLRLLLFPVVLLKREVFYQKAKNNPREATDRMYYSIFGKHIDYENPKSINEKIHWLKFYSDTSQWSLLADKYRVREYVASKGLGYILNELYAVYHNLDDIDISKLPNSFVIKMNNRSGDTLMLHNKSLYTNKQIKNYFRKLMDFRYAIIAGEYYYKDIKSCIIVEKLLDVKKYSCSLTDYKFYCFNGKAEFILVCSERNEKSLILDNYDINWKHLDDVGVPSDHFNIGNGGIQKPSSFNQMLLICEKLSEGLPFVRVDLYEINDLPVFGEMTLTPFAGFITYYTSEFLDILGKHLKLPRGITKND